ncbi:MAG: glycosyltransferase family 2 protein [Coriobacteriia bacterium]|nr:glycosyltransferase family 2 protein [Coriobacteriia bacterium]
MTKSWTKEHKGVLVFADAIPGALTWIAFFSALVGLLVFPRAWLTFCACFMCYFVLRMVFTLVFYVTGEYRIRSWERCDWTAGEHSAGPGGFSPAEAWHVVIVPNYKEPVEILERTLDGLAIQHRAAERVVVVLGMEERESGSAEKGRILAEKYADRFARVLVTVHPGGLPDELPGKSSNQSWAATEAYEVLANEMDVPLDRMTVTSCDADSVLHPRYFAAVSKMFALDTRRHARFFQAPLFYTNNLWQVPGPTRFTMWLGHACQLAELAVPFYEPLPISTYTLSLQTAAEAGWWDPMVIAEDWHNYLNVMFERRGDVKLLPVFLPTRGDATDGDSFFSGLKNRHDQVMRHSWGAEDCAYVLRRIVKERHFHGPAIFRFVQVLHDHVMRTAGWFLVISTYLLVPLAKPVYAASMTRVIVVDHGIPILPYVLGTGAVALVTTVAMQVVRFPPPGGWKSPKLVLELVFHWLTMAFFGFYLGALPAWRAQTRLMFGIPLVYKVTPKRAVREAAA